MPHPSIQERCGPEQKPGSLHLCNGKTGKCWCAIVQRKATSHPVHQQALCSAADPKPCQVGQVSILMRLACRMFQRHVVRKQQPDARICIVCTQRHTSQVADRAGTGGASSASSALSHWIGWMQHQAHASLAASVPYLEVLTPRYSH